MWRNAESMKMNIRMTRTKEKWWENGEKEIEWRDVERMKKDGDGRLYEWKREKMKGLKIKMKRMKKGKIKSGSERKLKTQLMITEDKEWRKGRNRIKMKKTPTGKAGGLRMPRNEKKEVYY